MCAGLLQKLCFSVRVHCSGFYGLLNNTRAADYQEMKVWLIDKAIELGVLQSGYN